MSRIIQPENAKHHRYKSMLLAISAVLLPLVWLGMAALYGVIYKPLEVLPKEFTITYIFVKLAEGLPFIALSWLTLTISRSFLEYSRMSQDMLSEDVNGFAEPVAEELLKSSPSVEPNSEDLNVSFPIVTNKRPKESGQNLIS